ncbi:MAG: ThiF family adenylyltransferase [Gemmataceae bacterium]|nr:ThiF family adenylyltransferase [Gemmataceae bacterium]
MHDPRFSRPVAAAARLGELAPDCHRFVNKRVLLTGEQEAMATANGREALLSSLRLLVRICPNLSLVLPAGAEAILNECHELADRIAFGSAVEFLAEVRDLTDYDAILSIGTRARPDLPWTVINSNGWLVRVSSGGASLTPASNLANPVGALAAACAGVAEVFKRLIRLRERRGRLLDGLTFSLHSYRCGEDNPGPDLPADLPLDLLLVGAGAIGNGIIHLLSQLPTSGRAWIVDAQTFQEENLGTCLLIGPQELGTPKAMFAERVLRGRLQARGFPEELAAFQRRLGSELSYPRVIVTGLDNIDARHEAQALWPDLIIDGAIGDFPCQVSRHQWGEDSACLVCLFRQPPGPAAETVASLATGLSRSRVQQAEDTVTEEDARAAPADRQAWLRERVGRQICSVVREGVAQQISQEGQREGFTPSVPFVACLSACMVVAELVKSMAGWTTALETRYQFDVLCGPGSGSMVPQEKRRDCECFTRSRNIDVWRRDRNSTCRQSLS